AIARAFLDRGIDVICDKPMTTTVADALDLVQTVQRTGLVFGVTHNYTGYPMVRQAREMIAAGELGEIRIVNVEYVQDWLTTKVEDTGQKQAAWRVDPSRAGAGGSLGDIGTHAHNLACFVTGLAVRELAADVSRMVPGRKLDDNAHILLRFEHGARGMLWSSQVAPGNENGLRLRVYGEKGGLEWHQEHPNQLRFTPTGKPPQMLSRGGPSLGAAAPRATRIPSGHPEGYLEAFANLYRDLAEQIRARRAKRKPDPAALLVPTVKDGADGVRFIHAAVESSERNAAWVRLGA
ncbi:MAG TPA: Gfo/Idh/MocA family oxidoreductase, partial [Gemmatimonadales bacterium]